MFPTISHASFRPKSWICRLLLLVVMDYLILVGHLHILILHIIMLVVSAATGADDCVPLTVCNVCVVCEEDGVVRHHWITVRQNASRHVAHAVQDAVVHQEVVHQQPKLLYSSL